MLRFSAVLWFIWGLVHVMAGVLTMKFILSEQTAKAVGGIADKVNPAVLSVTYPPAAGAVIGQHGFNLFWIGLATTICAFYVWKNNKNAIILAALIAGPTDLGYFLFMDLGGFVNFVPGTIMTFICAAAIALSFTAHFRSKTKE